MAALSRVGIEPHRRPVQRWRVYANVSARPTWPKRCAKLSLMRQGFLISLLVLGVVGCGGSSSSVDDASQSSSESTPGSSEASATSGSDTAGAETSGPEGADGEVASEGESGSGDGSMAGNSTSSTGAPNSGSADEVPASSGGDASDPPEPAPTSTAGGAEPTPSEPAPGTQDPQPDPKPPQGGGTPPDCETVACLRPYECVAECGGEIVSSGCCPCAEGLIDQFVDCR